MIGFKNGCKQGFFSSCGKQDRSNLKSFKGWIGAGTRMIGQEPRPHGVAEKLGLGRSVTPCGSGSNHSFPNGCLMPKADDRRKMLEKCLPRSCVCSEQGFNGTRSRVNEERQPRSMIVFVCGKNKGFSRTCGKADCKSMMNW